MSAPESGFLRN